MARNNLTILFASGLFIGLPAYAVISSIDYQRYYAPEEHWKEEVEGARAGVKWYAQQVRASEIEVQRLQDTRSSRLKQEIVELSAIPWGRDVEAMAEEKVRMETEFARDMLSSRKADLHKRCQSFREAASKARKVTGDPNSLDLQLPSSCD